MLDILAASASTTESSLVSFVPIVGMILIFWFLLIRPQMKQQKEHREKIAGIKKGDQIITGGGKLGKVTKVDDHYAEVEIAQGVRVKVVKSTIADILPPGGNKPAND